MHKLDKESLLIEIRRLENKIQEMEEKWYDLGVDESICAIKSNKIKPSLKKEIIKEVKKLKKWNLQCLKQRRKENE